MIGILDLLQEDGIQAKRKTGMEFCSPCPACGGKDRFIIWPAKGEGGRAWCRQCDLNVDPVGYLLKVRGIPFRSAAEYLGKALSRPVRGKSVRGNTGITKPPNRPDSGPHVDMADAGVPPPLWRSAAEEFVSWAADNLRNSLEHLEWLSRERGISPETANRWRLGWNSQLLRRPGEKWGTETDIILPVGFVIPNFRDGVLFSVKIRRDTQKPDVPKYHLVKGSKTFPYLLPGDGQNVVAIVESELDALLLWNEARHLVTPVAVGGCANRPARDIETSNLIAGAEILLDCMDDDQAGEKVGAWWKNWFPQCTRWKPIRKDPGEMFQTGLSIRRWMFEGIRERYMEKGVWPGEMDFFEAVEGLAVPLPEAMLNSLSEDEIERIAIMAENGIPVGKAEANILQRRESAA